MASIYRQPHQTFQNFLKSFAAWVAFGILAVVQYRLLLLGYDTWVEAWLNEVEDDSIARVISLLYFLVLPLFVFLFEIGVAWTIKSNFKQSKGKT